MAKNKRLLRSPAFLIPTILLLILIAAFALFILYNKSEVEKRLDAIRAAGYPATCAELDQWYPDVPFEENAAEFILNAADFFVNWNDKPVPADQRETYHLEPLKEPNYMFIGMMPGPMPGMMPGFQLPKPESTPPPDWNIKNNKLLPIIGEAILPDPPDHLSAESLAVIEDFLTDNAQALQLLHQAATFDRARYPVDLSQGINTLFTHLGGIRHSAQLLAMQALFYAEKNQSDQAVQSMLALFHIAGSLKDEPLLIAYLVKTACDSLGYDILNDLLNHYAFNTQQLQTLQSSLANTDHQTVLARALVGDRCWGNDFFTNPEDAGTGILPITFTAMRISGLLEVQHVTYLDILEDFVEATKLKPSQGYQESLNMQTKIEELPFYQFMVQDDMYLFSHSFLIHTRIISLQRLTLTALAVEQFRLTHNRLPETLVQLTPDLFTEIPRDSFDPNNHTLRYRLNETGYTLYSVGEDQTDNNGTQFDAEGNTREPGTDLTFTVLR